MSSFKPGDWVKHIAFKSKHKCISINDGEFDDKVSVTNSPSFDNEFMIDYELWQPKVGEWCWFWNKDMDTNQSPRLAQFHLMTEELQKPMDFPAFYQTKYKATKLGYLYDFCEPFIGQLPTSLKDQS